MSYGVFQVAPDKLREYWPQVKEELTRLRRRFAVEWIEEDIYADIRNGLSYLYIVPFDEKPAGFYVLQPRRNGELLLHIVCMFRTAPRAAREAVMHKGVAEIRQTAIGAGYKKVVAYSVRPGATRYFRRFGFTPTEVKFEMKI